MTTGTASMTLAGALVAGSGTNRMRLAYNITDANAALATFKYTAPASPGSDTIKLAFFDQHGTQAAVTIPVTIT